MTRLLPLLALALAACTASDKVTPDPVDSDSVVDGLPGEHAYDMSRLLEVEIELDPDDWEALRHQDRNLLDLLGGEDCIEDTWESPYTWFIGSATIDGVAYEQVEVRKKGLIGSVVSHRPSLKLDLDDHVEDQRFDGLDRLTLNNGNQDGSRIKPCLGYAAFADAGLPASRCSYAHVVVNGEDLGVYANVEPVKKPLLERHFGDGDGTLYEGTLSDFREGWTGTFDDKTEESDFADIQALTEALEADDDALIGELEAVMDLNQYLEFWAAEVLIGHWDGYAGNTNNYFVYNDPSDGLLHFLPWGIDAILAGDEPFGEDRPTSIVANATLPARLAEHPEGRARFEQAQDRLLAEAWDTDVMLERFDAAVALTDGYVWPNNDDEGWYNSSVGEVRRFLRTRESAIGQERAQGVPALEPVLRDNPCLVEQGRLQVSFETTWASYPYGDIFGDGAATWDVVVAGEPVPVTPLGAVVGVYNNVTVLFVTAQLPDGANIGLYGEALNDWSMFDEAGTIDPWSDLDLYVLYDGDGDFEGWEVWAYLDGDVILTDSATRSGAPVVGGVDLAVMAGL